jgi:uncharacterized membrane protein YcaP (DUF421 family)
MVMENALFDSWESLTITAVSTTLAYLAIVFLLRVTGKRTLSKMNAFDFIVTVALGSALANVALNRDVAVADGAVAFFFLIILQLIITWVSARYRPFKHIITSQPSLLLYKGAMLEKMMKKERVTKEELHLAARNKGIHELSEIDAIILETTGKLTIISKLPDNLSETLQDVDVYHHYHQNKPRPNLTKY